MAGTYSYRIASRDLDGSGRARVCTVGSLILEAAGDDADTLGFGVDDLRSGSYLSSKPRDCKACDGIGEGAYTHVRDRVDAERNAASAGFSRQIGAAWVLSRVAIELRRLPVRGEVLDIYTWVSDYGRVMTTRNMTISSLSDDLSACPTPVIASRSEAIHSDFEEGRPKVSISPCLASGSEIGKAVTQWAMIDLETRRPMDLSALSNRGASLVDRTPPIDVPKRVPAMSVGAGLSRSESPQSAASALPQSPQDSFRRPTPPLGATKDFEEIRHTVVYSDIDFNGHVNSMKYLEWMIDTLGAEELAALDPPPDRPLRVDINYLHEARLGDAVVICRDGLVFEVRNTDGVALCRAVFQ